jgi:hypothetical protein
MSKDALVTIVKRIVGLGRENKLDEVYSAYKDLFTEEWFTTLRPEDQRQALRLMIHAKQVPQPPSEKVKDAHRAALAPLTELVSTLNDPADYEMLGVCHVVLGNNDSAMSIFKAALSLERDRSPGSDLTGTLMKRVSML